MVFDRDPLRILLHITRTQICTIHSRKNVCAGCGTGAVFRRGTAELCSLVAGSGRALSFHATSEQVPQDRCCCLQQGVINWLYFCFFAENSSIIRFLKELEGSQRLMDQYVGDNMDTAVSPDLGDGEAKVVLVTHDESSFEVHDGKRFVWI